MSARTVWVCAYDIGEALGKRTLYPTSERAEYYRCEPQELYEVTARRATDLKHKIADDSRAPYCETCKLEFPIESMAEVEGLHFCPTCASAELTEIGAEVTRLTAQVAELRELLAETSRAGVQAGLRDVAIEYLELSATRP